MKRLSIIILILVGTLLMSGSTTTLAVPPATHKPHPVHTPKPTPAPTPVPTATATPAPTATPTPRPTATATPVPTATPTVAPTATPTPTPTPVPTPTSTPVTGSTIVAVGDIHGEGSDADSVATNNLVNTINPSAILGLGDYQYTTGTCANFTTAGHYNSDWGAQQSRMYATLGPTHDYDQNTANAAGYFSGACAGQSTKSAGALLTGGTQNWYTPFSFNIGNWHIVQLPSVCERYSGSTCSVASINTWLANDLAANASKPCTIAYFHQPYWTSTTSVHSATTTQKPWITTLYNAGAEIVISGHNHMYERFAPQNPDNASDPTYGMTGFVVGTGGIGFYSRTSTAANSVAYQNSSYGVLRLDLGASSATTRFIPTSGTYSDTSTVTCHGAPGSTPTPTPTPAPTATPAPTSPPVAGFTSIFRDDFSFTGSLPSNRYFLYPSTWKDTSGNGTYTPSNVSSHDGTMDVLIRTVNGVHQVAAIVPLVTTNTSRGDQLYGAYEIRFRADSMVGYKGAWLLWPQSGVWPRDGEIDFPEGDFNETISAFMHHQGATSSSDQDAFFTTADWQTWHTARTEWTPTAVRFYLDGTLIGTSISRIPNTPMHWVIQNETTLDGSVPADSVTGHIYVDWLEAFSWN